MVSFTSRNPSFFSTAMLFSGLLLLALGLHGSSSPAGVDHEESYWGMRLLIRRNNHGIFTNMDITDENRDNLRPIVDDLKTSVMCDMYNFYRDYSTALANIRPDTLNFTLVKADYSAAQYVALKNTLSACQWINNSSSVSIDGCTLSSISTTCYIVRYHRMNHIINQTEPTFDTRMSNWNGCLGCDIH